MDYYPDQEYTLYFILLYMVELLCIVGNPFLLPVTYIFNKSSNPFTLLVRGIII